MRRIFIVLALMASACSDPEHAEQVLRGAGYKNIEMTGFEWLGCGKDDQISDGFTAKGQDGRVVTGVVCCGVMGKSCTIRVD